METSSSEFLEKQIPREFKIARPLPPICPSSVAMPETFPSGSFTLFHRLVTDLLPHFELLPTSMSVALREIKDCLDSDSCESIFEEMAIKQYLLKCQDVFFHLVNSPSLTKLSLLHNELFQASEIMHERQWKMEFSDFCLMLMADVVDVYHSHFSDIIEQKFWSKSKTVDDLIRVLLNREFERLRLLNPTTYKALASVALRKAIDTAPNSGVSKLIQWSRANHNVCD